MIIYLTFVEEADIILTGELYLVAVSWFKYPGHKCILEAFQLVVEFKCLLHLVDLCVPANSAGIFEFIHYSYKTDSIIK